MKNIEQSTETLIIKKKFNGGLILWVVKRDRLVLDNMKLAYYLARRYRPAHIGLEDAQQEALYSLTRAATKYIDNKIPFSIYASKSIYFHLINLDRRYKSVATISLEAPISEDYSLCLEDVIADPDMNIEDKFLMEESLRVALEGLKSENREIVLRVIVKGETCVSIAKALGVSRQRVNYLLNTSISALRKSLENLS